MRESIPDADSKCELLAPLGFGHAMSSLPCRRRGSMYEPWPISRTLRWLFAPDAASGCVSRPNTSISRGIFSPSATSPTIVLSKASARPKAPPAAGTAELIVDITTTGGTLAANALKILDDGVILRSEANFVASLTAAWTDETREAARIILSRIAAEEVARTTREVSARVAQADVELFAHAEVMFAARARRHLSDGWLTLTCPKDKVSRSPTGY